MAAAGMPDGEYMLGTFAVSVANGRALSAEDLAQGKHTLAGSVLTLDRAVSNLQQFTGATLQVASSLASHNPARLLGLDDSLGLIHPGQPANFNVFNSSGAREQTVIYGRTLE
jgi:N-acetylglucosamine-6-phosphate deacetylase